MASRYPLQHQLAELLLLLVDSDSLLELGGEPLLDVKDRFEGLEGVLEQGKFRLQVLLGGKIDELLLEGGRVSVLKTVSVASTIRTSFIIYKNTTDTHSADNCVQRGDISKLRLQKFVDHSTDVGHVSRGSLGLDRRIEGLQ